MRSRSMFWGCFPPPPVRAIRFVKSPHWKLCLVRKKQPICFFSNINGATYIYGGFYKWVVPQNGWFILENTIKIDYSVIPHFRKPPYIYIASGEIYCMWHEMTVISSYVLFATPIINNVVKENKHLGIPSGCNFHVIQSRRLQQLLAIPCNCWPLVLEIPKDGKRRLARRIHHLRWDEHAPRLVAKYPYPDNMGECGQICPFWEKTNMTPRIFLKQIWRSGF